MKGLTKGRRREQNNKIGYIKTTALWDLALCSLVHRYKTSDEFAVTI
jgi:hypothetical protein